MIFVITCFHRSLLLGIPVTIHAGEKKYVPEMIFGELLTGSSFDDTETKVTGGRNGLGAKLANIFSTKFQIRTSSSEYGKSFSQEFSKNMVLFIPISSLLSFILIY